MVNAKALVKRLLKSSKYEYYAIYNDSYAQQVAICAHKEIRDIEFYSLDVSEENIADELLFTMSKIKSGGFVLVDLSFPGDMTTYGMRFDDPVKPD